jgi:ATP-dependent helicase/nuclease subunit B
MDGYGKLAANILKQNDIPYFLDYKRHVTDNPFIAAITWNNRE